MVFSTGGKNLIRLGEKQELNIVKEVEFGVYLAEEGQEEERVLLPKKQVPQQAEVGDSISVFVYKDSKDRLISTTAQPKLMMGQTAVLRVVSVQKIGAFLDWGLEKDLFLPYKEQESRVRETDEILVRLYIDKSKRLCASMKGLYDMLSQDPPYEAGDAVQGRVYEFSDNFGAFVAVDDQYSARIPRHEDYSSYRIGSLVETKVKEKKPDGKLELTLREQAHVQMGHDAERILELLQERGGSFPFTDKASPEIILREVKMSKGAFKRAIGRLYKERKIEIGEGEIHVI
jgi:predicted RNA-binding protein (virulence factor B family)